MGNTRQLLLFHPDCHGQKILALIQSNCCCLHQFLQHFWCRIRCLLLRMGNWPVQLSRGRLGPCPFIQVAALAAGPCTTQKRQTEVVPIKSTSSECQLVSLSERSDIIDQSPEESRLFSSENRREAVCWLRNSLIRQPKRPLLSTIVFYRYFIDM